MQQQQPPPQQSTIMLTSLDKIPQKQSNNVSVDDMSDDPLVKDVLSEFEKELNINEQHQNNKNYNINYQQHQQPPQQQQLPPPQQLPPQQQQQYQQRNQNSKTLSNYIDNILITKSFIICIIVALIINPYIYSTIISKIPADLSTLFDSYNYLIKLILIFITIYIFMFYKLV
jgi:hypothetical protein